MAVYQFLLTGLDRPIKTIAPTPQSRTVIVKLRECIVYFKQAEQTKHNTNTLHCINQK